MLQVADVALVLKGLLGGELHAGADGGVLGVGVLGLRLGRLELVLEEGEGFCEVIALGGEVLDELLLAVEFFLWAAISGGRETGERGD